VAVAGEFGVDPCIALRRETFCNIRSLFRRFCASEAISSGFSADVTLEADAERDSLDPEDAERVCVFVPL
jgi:hypothetical protein